LLNTAGEPFKPVSQGAKLVGSAEIITQPIRYPAQSFRHAAEVLGSGLQRRGVVHQPNRWLLTIPFRQFAAFLASLVWVAG
jgi:hypothetical protein